ncbi:YolD-like protein [Melghiribacillus thermohalophilus]|uniref:YolD-like protein n=1 Tax=Melghiribacillus thermohalophilus TaxID=1324956 RepID=A0A4R3N9S1_9BACI|nr:YolD-like family protein [Melghiribacillus thermohalophilus]TCT25507.1 YolD-like protein [Melghiribacillus thermohalophilus]
MLKDRGTIKWTSLMLPEHVKELKQMWQDETKKPRPILDQQELEEFNERLLEAFEHGKRIEVTRYQNGRENSLSGKIEKIDAVCQIIVLKTYEQVHSIPFRDITNLEITGD